MKKFKEISLQQQAIKTYFFSLLFSLILFVPFDKLYAYIFKPSQIGGNLFFPISNSIETLINGSIFGLYFFLPFFVFWLIKKKQWLIWFIGAIIPLLIALVGGLKDLFWALVLSAAGWGLAQAVLLIKSKKKI